MANSWIIIELSDMVENPDYCDIESAMRDVFGDRVDYFIPIHYQKLGSYTSTSVLIPGYVFVKDTPRARELMVNIRDNRLFSGPVVNAGKVKTVTAAVVVGLKNRLRNSLRKKFVPGIRVRVCDGALKNLVGEVVGMDDGGLNVMVKIMRLSREILAPVPATLVEEIDKE